MKPPNSTKSCGTQNLDLGTQGDGLRFMVHSRAGCDSKNA